ncbi:zinc-ribbon domain-containing protein [candidate division FCPU426 bacterium]|nr:zinc-ribbon domain-containing protein [candidate division FCPU426 bacterium]
MFFIFGWGNREQEDVGPTFRIKCPNCDKTEFWHLIQVKNYFTLFFIPVFPYETKNLIMCPVCTNAIEVHEPLTQKIQAVADIHRQFAGEKITEFEYKVKMENKYEPAYNEFMQYVEGINKNAGNSILCPFCGKVAHTDKGGLFIDKSCVKCGKELPGPVIMQVKMAFPGKWQE